jgi:hypothetical protein
VRSAGTSGRNAAAIAPGYERFLARRVRSGARPWPPAARWQLLSHCLDDATMPLDVRAAGALLLLYGQFVTRIVRLTTADLCHDTYLHAGAAPVLLPPKAAAVIRAQRDAGPAHITYRHPSQDARPLFPGRRHGQHLGAEALTRRLRQHGIEPRQARNQALVTWAAALALTAAAAAALAAAGTGAHLAGGTLDVLRNVTGITGIGLLCAAGLGGGLAWAGPTGYLLVGAYGLYTQWHHPALTTPWIWPARPPHDLGAAICAALVFTLGMTVITVRGARDPADE